MPKTRPAATATRHVVVYFLNDSSIQRKTTAEAIAKLLQPRPVSIPYIKRRRVIPQRQQA
jgi:hypothetical protein